MGATVCRGTMPECLTPVCNECGIHLCWDISEDEYAEYKQFWDDWICQSCNGGIAMKHPKNIEDVSP